MKTKIVYVVISTDNDIYLEQAWISAYSVKYYNPTAFITFVTDEDTYKGIVSSDRKNILQIVDEIIPIPLEKGLSNMKRSRWIKTNLRNLIKGDFLFIDTDTVITEDLSEIDKWDIKMGAVLDLHCTFECFPFAKGIKKQLYKVFSCIPCQATQFFNSGVLYVKECEETRRFFTSWHQNWTHSCSKKVYIDQLSLMKTCDEQPNFITSISGIYNCQILGSIQYLHTAKIVHFFNAKWNDNTLCPFFGKDIYIKVKQARGITEETKNMLLHCKEYFVSPSIPICSYDVDIWYSSIFTLLRQLHTRHEILYKLVNFTSRCIIKLSNYLIYNSLTNRGGGKKGI